jgi:PTS system glucitol/sorbitol-specific IIA component
VTESPARYRSVVTGIGERAEELISGGVLVLFIQSAPKELAEFSVLHSHPGFEGELRVGETVILGEGSFVITAVGDLATKNLRELGHLVLRFDGREEVDLPGEVHLQEAPVPRPKPGDVIEIRE